MQHSPGFLKLVQNALTHVKEISVDDAAFRARQPNTYLIDVREESEWNAGHADGAIHLGKGIIERDIETSIPDHDATLLLYCGGGYRSALAADNLQMMGYTNVISVAGGYKAWVTAKLPTTTRPTVVPRSPYEKIAGIYHLARLIDKVRLCTAGKLPGYNYLTVGFDKMLLEFLCVDAHSFEKAVLAASTDDEVLAWLKNKLGPSRRYRFQRPPKSPPPGQSRQAGKVQRHRSQVLTDVPPPGNLLRSDRPRRRPRRAVKQRGVIPMPFFDEIYGI